MQYAIEKVVLLTHRISGKDTGKAVAYLMERKCAGTVVVTASPKKALDIIHDRGENINLVAIDNRVFHLDEGKKMIENLL